MQKTRIDWADFTTNPVDGLCLHKCSYCYEAKRRKRFKLKEEITFNPNWLDNKADNFTKKYNKPAKIFVGSTHDIFGKWIPKEWIEEIIEVVKENPQHIFQFLTKSPMGYYAFNFPKNCWLGATTVDANTAGTFTDDLEFIYNNKIFISAEPLLEDIADYIDYDAIDWIIVGAMTGKFAKQYRPKRIWVENIVNKAKEYNIPVFLKNNLQDIWKDKLIKEFP